jgi:hypothetical protein
MNTSLLRNYINGQWISSATGAVAEQRDPTDLRVVTGFEVFTRRKVVYIQYR